MTAVGMAARLALIVATFLAGLILIPHPATLTVARLVALVAIVHLIWRYHRLAAWWEVEIGRSTMAIKGSILALAVGANLRSLDEYTTANLSVWAESGVALGWLCMAVAVVHRDRLVARIQRSEDRLPSEDIREEA